MIGRAIGRYHILELLGRGGMATVWKATDQLLGRTVAIKILDENIASIPTSRRRFQREGEIASQLEHPCIVPVFDAGEADGIAYLVMKLIDGETLAQVVTHRLQPIDEVLRIGAAVAGALGYAHASGVVHRDISPRNIMLTSKGDVFVLDFGLARVADRSKSTTGNIVGTLAYLSPEALNGRPTNAHSDLYSLGVVLYEALTGSLPFHAERDEALGYAILNSAVEPPSRLRPEVGSELDAVVLKSLARDPAKRHADAGEFVAALDRLRAASAGTASRVSVRNEAGPGADVPGFAKSARPDRRRAQTYLAVLPVEAPRDGDVEHGRLLDGLANAARAGLANLDHVHVVDGGQPVDGEDGRAFSRRVGANLLLRSTARFSGSNVRITFALVDPERDLQVGGDVVDGSPFQPFELEDRMVVSLRAALGVRAGSTEVVWRARPRDPAAAEHFTQALAYLRRFDHEPSIDSAIALLGGLIDSEGESAALQAAMTRACLHKYRATKQRVWESRAAQACERAVALDAEMPEVLLAVGELHVVAGRNEQALAVLDRAVALKPDLYEAHMSRARALDGANQASEAEQACKLAIALRSDDWRAYHVLGLILFRHGRYGEAVRPWQRVVELTPDNATVHRNLGGALFHLERYDDALAAYARANEIRPHAEAYWNLGAGLFSLGRYEESVEAFEKAVALNPSDAFAWGNLGNACRRVPGREARMREALERAVALTQDRLDRGPGEAEDWSRMAGWQVNLGRTADGERSIRRALAMAPDDVNCMVEAGKVFLRLGDRDEAVRWLKLAVENGHNVDELRRSPDLRALDGDAEFQCILKRGAPTRDAARSRSTERGRP